VSVFKKISPLGSVLRQQKRESYNPGSFIPGEGRVDLIASDRLSQRSRMTTMSFSAVEVDTISICLTQNIGDIDILYCGALWPT